MTAIFKKYNKLVRPIKTVVMRIRVSLRQIVALDEKNQIMTSNIYVTASWRDGRLKWLPYSKGANGVPLFNNLTDLVVPATSIWTPDLFIINTAGTNGFIPISSSNLAEINFKGDVFLLLSVTNLQTKCKMYVYYFPFDTQNCSIIVGSWKHSTDRINFETGVGKIDVASYQPHPIWTLKKVVVNSVFVTDRFAPSSNETNEDIAFYFSLNRGSGYYMANLVACFVLNCVTLLAYFLPFATQVTLCILNSFYFLFDLCLKIKSYLISKFKRYDFIFNIFSAIVEP
jgi:nicotinic acetylcholine receptor